MKRRFIVFALLMTAAVSLQAAGKITQYTNRLSFGASDAVDWIVLGATPANEKGLQVGNTFTNAHSLSGLIAISGGDAATGANLKRFDEGLNWFGTFFPGDHLLTTGTSPGPIRISFSTGPVYGAGLQIQAAALGPFTGTLKAFDAGGALLGTVTVNGVSASPRPANNTAPFMGIRSSLAEIASLEIDSPGAIGLAVNRLDIATNAFAINNNAFFVSQLYRDIWNVAPDPAGVSNWLTQLAAGTVTRAQVADAFFNDARFYPNASYVCKLSLGLLLRDPDLATWTSMFTQMQGGATRAQMLASVMAQPGYQAVYGSLTNVDFVTALYQNLLGRAPDTFGLNYWTLLLNLGVSRAAVIDGFLTSPESDAHSLSRVKANLMYFSFLRRSGEPAGLNYWTIVLNFGVPPSVVIQGFITSPEYLARF